MFVLLVYLPYARWIKPTSIMKLSGFKNCDASRRAFPSAYQTWAQHYRHQSGLNHCEVRAIHTLRIYMSASIWDNWIQSPCARWSKMVRETRHLWVGNLPENISEERIKEHFKRYVVQGGGRFDDRAVFCGALLWCSALFTCVVVKILFTAKF